MVDSAGQMESEKEGKRRRESGVRIEMVDSTGKRESEKEGERKRVV